MCHEPGRQFQRPDFGVLPNVQTCLWQAKCKSFLRFAFDIETRKFNLRRALKEGLPITPDFINYIESWAKRTLIVPPRMGLYIIKNLEIQRILREYCCHRRIFALILSMKLCRPYSIFEVFCARSAFKSP